MTGNPWDRKRTQNTKAPDEIGDERQRKGHHLHAIAGIFGEQLVWECKHCGITRHYSRDIDEECPDAP